ncbi:hypothetical protein P20480_3965 [Pseudoalteromonas sp. BSi20480]|nr:hypothetical protein P20480_3965 [Pseudoalteromonas sp. BSi20480]
MLFKNKYNHRAHRGALRCTELKNIGLVTSPGLHFWVVS